MKSIFLLSGFVLITASYAQDLEWAKQAENGKSAVYDITSDYNNDIITAHRFSDTVDFDYGGSEFYLEAGENGARAIQKTDAEGNLLWVRKIEVFAEQHLIIASIITDSEGSIYATGNFYGAIDFDPGPGIEYLEEEGSFENFILKLDAYGNFVWAVSYGGECSDYSNELAIDSEDNVYTVGHFCTTADFDPSEEEHIESASEYGNGYILKLNTHGEFQWVRTLPSLGPTSAETIEIDRNDNVYVGGYFSGITDFDLGDGVSEEIAEGESDAFLLKLDTDGDDVWVETTGGSQFETIMDIKIAFSGEVYTAGTTDSPDIDLDSGVGEELYAASGDYDHFIQKIDEDGSFIAGYGFGTVHRDYNIHLAVAPTDELYVAGAFNGTMDIEPGAGETWLTSAVHADDYIYDLFFLKLDNDFVLTESFVTGNDHNDMPSGIFCGTEGSFYIGGHYASEEVDFDPSAETEMLESIKPGFDSFLLKFQDGHLGIQANDEVLSMSAYPNPFVNEFTIQFDDIQEEVNITLLDASGRVISNEKHTSVKRIQTHINVPTGLYYAKVCTADGERLIKLLKM